MITWGFVPSYSDAVTIDAAFTINGLTLIGAYIFVSGSSGDIVWENIHGDAQWLPGVQSGQTYLLGAAKILSVGTVNGTPRATTASGLVWMAVNQKFNTP